MISTVQRDVVIHIRIIKSKLFNFQRIVYRIFTKISFKNLQNFRFVIESAKHTMTRWEDFERLEFFTRSSPYAGCFAACTGAIVVSFFHPRSACVSLRGYSSAYAFLSATGSREKTEYLSIARRQGRLGRRYGFRREYQRGSVWTE